MKKLLIIAAILAALILGYRAGIEHALTHAEFWVLDLTETSGPWDYDLEIFLDGDWWTEALYIG